MATKATIIERGSQCGAYGMVYDEAIIDHPEHGRLYISEGFRHAGLGGGAYRWRHGMVAPIEPGIILAHLDNPLSDTEPYTERDALQPLWWSGAAIARLAESLGL